MGFGMIDQKGGVSRLLQDLIPRFCKLFVQQTDPGPMAIISGVAAGRGEMLDPLAVVTDEPFARGVIVQQFVLIRHPVNVLWLPNPYFACFGLVEPVSAEENEGALFREGVHASFISTNFSVRT